MQSIVANVGAVSSFEIEEQPWQQKAFSLRTACSNFAQRRASDERKKSLGRPRRAEQAREDGMSIASRQEEVEEVDAETVFRNRSCPQSVRARV